MSRPAYAAAPPAAYAAAPPAAGGAPAGLRSPLGVSWGPGRRILASLALLAVAATAACTAEAKSDDDQAPPFADCAALTASPTATPTSALAGDLPDLRLPCFSGGQPVALRELHGPALINIWASFCGPCRTELPVIQRTADRTAGRLTVLSVDSGDRRAAGASFAADHGITLPTLFDEDNDLLTGLGRISLPITVFIDADGRQFQQLLPLTEASIDDLVRTHTGVAVAS